jgi:hypothetical protein
VTPEPIKDWPLTSPKEKLIKIGAKLVSHGRYFDFQMAEVAIPKNIFTGSLGSSWNYGRRSHQQRRPLESHAFERNPSAISGLRRRQRLRDRSEKRKPFMLVQRYLGYSM